MFELFNSGVINKRTLLILNYAKLNMNENQLAIILLIMEKSNYETQSFTPTQLSEFMAISKEKIEKEMSDLLNNNLVKIEQKNKKTIINFTPLFTKIVIMLEEQQSLNTEAKKYDYIEKIINQKLSKEQIQQLNDFAEKGISSQKIKTLLIGKNVLTFTDIVKELNQIAKNNKPLKITKYNWLND